MLQKLKKNFKLSIIVSTPYMDEAVQCDRIAVSYTHLRPLTN